MHNEICWLAGRLVSLLLSALVVLVVPSQSVSSGDGGAGGDKGLDGGGGKGLDGSGGKGLDGSRSKGLDGGGSKGLHGGGASVLRPLFLLCNHFTIIFCQLVFQLR